MFDARKYYISLLRYLDTVADLLKKEALLDDLTYGTPASPESRFVLSRYYYGSIDVLTRRYREAKRLTDAAYQTLEHRGAALGLSGEFSNPVVSGRFRHLATRYSIDSDFRVFLRRRTKGALKRIEEGKPVQPMGPAALLDAFEHRRRKP